MSFESDVKDLRSGRLALADLRERFEDCTNRREVARYIASVVLESKERDENENENS